MLSFGRLPDNEADGGKVVVVSVARAVDADDLLIVRQDLSVTEGLLV